MRFFIYLAESFKIAIEIFRSYKLRSFLTALGIWIGVIVIVVIISVIQGLNKYVREQIASLGSDTLYIERMPWVITNEREWLRVKDRPDITMKEAQAIEELATLVKAVAPTAYTGREVKFRGEKLERVTIVGTSEDYLETSNATPEYGRFLTDLDVHYRRNVCVIGWEVADKLFRGRDPLGRRILIGEHPFRVVGVLEKRGNLFGFNLDVLVLVPIEVFQKLWGTRRSLEIQVKVVDPSMLEEAKYQLTGILRRVRRLEATEENNFSINEQSLLTTFFENSTRMLWIVLVGVGSISLFVGGVGIMNIMLVSVTERTREIGVRKAIGARKADVLLQFLIESMMISAIGVALGILTALAAVAVINAKTPLPADISLWVVFLGIGFVVTLGTFFGIYPAWKAAKLDPIEALRYE